jgi:hypothetical protein
VREPRGGVSGIWMIGRVQSSRYGAHVKFMEMIFLALWGKLGVFSLLCLLLKKAFGFCFTIMTARYQFGSRY